MNISDPQQGLIVYRDRKRLLWLGSLLYPVLSLSGIGLYLVTGNEWMLLVPLLATYLGVPLLDWLRRGRSEQSTGSNWCPRSSRTRITGGCRC